LSFFGNSVDRNFSVSHPFRRKTRNGWGTEVFSKSQNALSQTPSPRGYTVLESRERSLASCINRETARRISNKSNHTATSHFHLNCDQLRRRRAATLTRAQCALRAPVRAPRPRRANCATHSGAARRREPRPLRRAASAARQPVPSAYGAEAARAGPAWA
jgi:hypothetical protein